MKKKGIKHFLTIIALCCSICYLLLRIFGLLDRQGHFSGSTHFIAYAVDGTTDYTLTYEQTLALYGTQIPLIYYNDDTGSSVEMTANFIGTTEDTDFNRPSTWKAIDFLSGGTTEQRSYVSNLAPGLIYCCTFSNSGFVSSNTTSHANISLDFSVSFDYLTRFRQNIFWSQKNAAGSYARRSNCFYNSTLGGLAFYPVSGNDIVLTTPNSNNFKTFLFPYPQLTDPVDESKTLSMAAVCADLQDDDLFSITATHCTLNNCGTYNDNLLNKEFVFIVTCPVITGMPAVTTTRPAQTTRSPYTGEYQVTTAQYTYDLSPLETNQINQIHIANENLNYVAGIFDGINIIIQQLNDIYNGMVANGEIAVDLLPGDPVKWYETDVKQQIDYIIEGHTTATLPDISTQMSFISSAYSFMMSQNWIAVLGGLSLAVSAACWILFEGRK